MSREAICPECGDPLSVSVEKDHETGGFKIVLFCEGAGDDVFGFEILTGLRNKDLENLRDVGKAIQKEMKIRLVDRKPEAYTE